MALEHQSGLTAGLRRGALPAALLSILLATSACSTAGSVAEDADAAEAIATENGVSHSPAKAMLDPVAFSALAPDDARTIGSSIQRALETAPDGAVRHGINVKGDIRWSVTPADTRVGPNVICRKFTSEIVIRGSRYEHNALACRKINGAWEIREN